MELSNIILGVIASLVSVIVYFAKLGIEEIKLMRTEMTAHKNDIVRIDTKVEGIEKRVTKLEK